MDRWRGRKISFKKWKKIWGENQKIRSKVIIKVEEEEEWIIGVEKKRITKRNNPRNKGEESFKEWIIEGKSLFEGLVKKERAKI